MKYCSYCGAHRSPYEVTIVQRDLVVDRNPLYFCTDRHCKTLFFEREEDMLCTSPVKHVGVTT